MVDGGGSSVVRDDCDLSMMSQEIIMTVSRESKDETEIRIRWGHLTPVVIFLDITLFLLKTHVHKIRQRFPYPSTIYLV